MYNTINKARLPDRSSSSSAPISEADKMKEEMTRDLVNAAKKDPNYVEDQ